jgi:sulfur-carrier protein
MIVRIPSPLRSYTNGAGQLESAGSTVAEVLSHLDGRHRGIKFRMIDEQNRIRQHIKIFINSQPVDDLAAPVTAQDTVHIICALSGG